MKYYFDIFDGDHWTRDDIGIFCETDHRARYQAVLALTEMAQEYLPRNGANMELTIRVRTAAGVVFSVRLDFDTEAGPELHDPTVILPHSDG
jgi:hypothetical protein